jgi:uncharacterized protein YndB with AHSA1/START domain
MAETIEAPLVQPEPLTLSRTFHARRATVFRAGSAAEHVARWFSPATYSVCAAKVELRVGGPFEVCMRAPDGQEHWMRGVVVEVTPEERLVIESRVEDETGRPLFRARTEVDFSDALGGTRLDITQTYVLFDGDAAAMTAGAAEGWRTTLDKLQAEVIRLGGAGESDKRSVVHATFHLERTYDAAPSRLWRALTHPDAKAKWFGGAQGEWELLERSMDVRPGGRERLKGRWSGGTVSTFDAVYHDVIEAERLVYSYDMYLNEKKISVSLATMQLKAAAEGTTLMVTEQGAFLDGYDDAGSREHGTGLLLDALGASLAD